MLGGIKTGGTEMGTGVGDGVIGWDAGTRDADVKSSLSSDSLQMLQSLSTPLHVRHTQKAVCHIPASPTLSPDSSSRHPFITHPVTHPVTHPITQPVTHLSPIIPYTTPACPVTCYAHCSCMMCMTMGSAQLFANLLSNHSCVCETSPPHNCRRPFWHRP